jgi:hypothetical protein
LRLEDSHTDVVLAKVLAIANRDAKQPLYYQVINGIVTISTRDGLAAAAKAAEQRRTDPSP